MASGSARGVRIENLIDGQYEKGAPNKTQIVVTSGSALYFANVFPAITHHHMQSIEKYELTKVRGIVTIPMYLHIALVPMTRFAEYNSTRVYNNQSKSTRDKMI